jgi:NADH-quinone oxidoreductase subunit H
MTIWEFLVNPFRHLGPWFVGLLMRLGFSPLVAELAMHMVAGFIVAFVPLFAVVFLIWEARKVIARMQDRLGPNNSGTYAGPYALLQTVADAIKIFTKELIIPAGADRIVFVAAPVLVVAVAISIWAVIPFGPDGLQFVDLNISAFYVVAISSLAPFSMIMGGWSSRNKYGDVGAFRAVSQIIGYEIPQILALFIVVMLTGSLSLQDIVAAQTIPFIVALPIPALIYFLASTAEVGRLPFELAEADSEIVAGYFTEYSGMMFGSFYLAEFINNLTASTVFSVLFLGGWRGPWVGSVPILGPVWLMLKAFMVFNILMLFWAAMPRLRIDQVLAFNWKFMVPWGIIMMIVIALVDKIAGQAGLTRDWERFGVLLVANVLIAALTYPFLRWAKARFGRQMQVRPAGALNPQQKVR